jgi:hypothetical protein
MNSQIGQNSNSYRDRSSGILRYFPRMMLLVLGLLLMVLLIWALLGGGHFTTNREGIPNLPAGGITED